MAARVGETRVRIGQRKSGRRPAPKRLYRGRSSEERRLERRERLLHAALQVFGTAGYANSSISDVCRAAGVTTRHFYEEFPSREALLIAAYDDTIQRLFGAYTRALSAAPDDVTLRVRAGVAALAREMADPRRVRIMTVEVVGASPEVERHRLEVERGFQRALMREAARLAVVGLVPQRDYSLSAVAVVGAVSALVTHWATSDDPPPVERIADEVMRLTLGIVTTSMPGDT